MIGFLRKSRQPEWTGGRSQRVRVNGQLSEEVRVTSGVPQGSVLGLILFLAYINDIWRNNESNTRLFADDYIIYRKITDSRDIEKLQKAYTGGRAWKAIGDRLIKPCYLGRGDHNRKIRTRQQRRDVGKYSFVNRTVTNWNQLPASLLASFPCKLSTFRKRVKNVVTSKGIQVRGECK